MRACGFGGDLDVFIERGTLIATVTDIDGRKVQVTLSAEQAREWGRVFLVEAQKADGRPLRLSGFCHAPVDVSFADIEQK